MDSGANGWNSDLESDAVDVETAVNSDHCVTTAAPLARLTNADANIGWFALVTRQRGTLVTVR